MPRSKCYDCDGTGKSLEMGEETCPQCVGTGRDKNSRLYAQPCRRCNGTGRVYYRRPGRICNRCGGSGTLQY